MRRTLTHHALAAAALAALSAALLVSCGEDDVKGVEPQIEVPVTRFNLGELPVLNRKLENVQVRNLGRADLAIERVFIKEENSAFWIESPLASVAAGQDARVVVGFRPTAQEDYRATLVIESDDPRQQVVEVELSGRGSTAAKMEVDPVLDFLLVCEGTGDIKRLKIRSTGTAPLILEEVRFKDGTSP
ncbi:MAG: choice-of-anchor D domain-containing protein, partial [Myxococcales bacterium]